MSEFIDKLRIALGDRRYAYRTLFKGPHGDVVLKDLARFCRAHKSTFHENERAHALAEGRREVWLRISHHLRLTPEQLWELYAGLPASED